MSDLPDSVRGLSDDAFSAVAESARETIRNHISELCEGTPDPEALQGVLLGAFGAVVDCWVALRAEGVKPAQLARALCATAQDLVGQAFALEGR